MKYYTYFFLSYLIIICLDPIYAQPVLINEVMSSNAITVSDEDGDFSDWIELFNPQDTSINLSGYGISDINTEPFKWIFPNIKLLSQDHLLIFASDKNRTDYVKHWETIITWGDYWKYRLGTSEPPADWKNLVFDDRLWLSGKSGFGYGDDDDSTIVPDVQSVYVRKTFTVQNLSTVVSAILHVDFDDGFVAYLNGYEIARANIGSVGIQPKYNESAATFVEPLMVYGGKPNGYIIQNIQSILQEGENVLTIQVHNYGTGSSDLTLIPFLSLGMDQTPTNPKGANPILILPNKFLHTNFKLSSEGETLIITNPQGNRIDSSTFGMIGSDVSFGRQPDGSNFWYLFSNPTPGDSNTTQGYTGITSEPIISISGGFYSSAININITPGLTGGTIHYTLDGSEPDQASQIYTATIQIPSTKVLRVKVFNTGMLPSKTVTNTYLINFNTQLPVISLSTNPLNLFDEEFGIYTLGDSAESSFPYFGANFWKDWERPVHVDYFENDGTANGFSLDAGVQIFGGWSRGHPQKSLAIFARGRYGYSAIDYKLFDDLPFTQYQSFVLRNSGNDWNSTMFRDGLMTNIVDDVDIDKQKFKPAVLFINGQYWGIHNIREKVNEHFLAQHNNVNADSLDLLESFAQLIQGDSSDYLALHSFIENNSMINASNYEFVKSKIDVNNFIKYFVSQIYFANTDWPGGNIKYWRKNAAGKWRWILFDTDFGFGLFEPNPFMHNSLEFATAPNGPNWPNPPWSTLFLRKLLDNQSFKNDFINCFADFSNTVFKSSAVINKINYFKSVIESEIPRHIQRWNAFNLDGWLSNIQVLWNFANQRLTYMQVHFIQKFGLSGIAAVNLSISDTSMGYIKLNSLLVDQSSWSGKYFKGVPINIIAQPKKGFRFVGWEGDNTSNEDSLIITLNSMINLIAVFEIDKNYSIPKIVINEINYNSSLAFNPQDWIEFYNNSDTSVNISSWIFRDSEDIHNYVIPEGTILGAREFIVLCSDDTLFHPLFPEVQNYIGNFNFGLSGGGELLMLLDNNLNVIDSLTYDDTNPWPSEADGHGPTLSLLNPNLENHLPQSWAPSIGYGTPGRVNDVFVNVDDKEYIQPSTYSLMQNYPNPFNPSTIIGYSISKNSYVLLRVFDVIGNEITTLVDEYKPAGIYEVEFNIAQSNSSRSLPAIASGVYFYQLKIGNTSIGSEQSFIRTKKMLLIK